VDPDSIGVIDKAELAEAVHEEAHAGSRTTDHLRQGPPARSWEAPSPVHRAGQMPLGPVGAQNSQKHLSDGDAAHGVEKG
jgi:hypothetical protein